MDKELEASSKRGSNGLAMQSTKASREMAARMLGLATAKFGKELTKAEADSWREILEGQPSGAIEYAFKSYFRNPPADGQRKWFPEEWEILHFLKDWHNRQVEDLWMRLREEKTPEPPPLLATEEDYAQLRKNVNELMAKVEIASANAFKPLKLRRKPLPDWKSKAAGE